MVVVLLMLVLVVVLVEIAIEDAAGVGVGGVVVGPGAEKHPASKHNIGRYLNGMNDVVLIFFAPTDNALDCPFSMSIALDVHAGYDTVFSISRNYSKHVPYGDPCFSETTGPTPQISIPLRS